MSSQIPIDPIAFSERVRVRRRQLGISIEEFTVRLNACVLDEELEEDWPWTKEAAKVWEDLSPTTRDIDQAVLRELAMALNVHQAWLAGTTPGPPHRRAAVLATRAKYK